MTQLSVWNPWRYLPREWDWDEDNFPTMFQEPQLDMYEEGDNIIVKVKAPGFGKEDIELSIESNRLAIKGNVKTEQEEGGKDKKYYRKEIKSMSFTRTVDLPVAVKSENANAVFENGILMVTLPKSEEAKPKKIEVQVK